MMNRLPVLMATSNTPSVTSLALCSYLTHNKDLTSAIHVGSAVDEMRMKQLLKLLALPVTLHKCEHNDHGYILNWLYANHVNNDDEFFLTLDSDVEFLEDGYIGEMVAVLKNNQNHFCV